MSPLKCFLCFQPSIEFPKDFEAVVADLSQVFNKFHSCAGVTNLILCQPCWMYLLRIHQFNDQLNKKTCHYKVLLFSKIQRSQGSLLETRDDCTVSEDLVVQSESVEEINSKVESDVAESASVHGCSRNKSDDPFIESPEFCKVADVSSTRSVSVSDSFTEEQSMEEGSAHTSSSDCESEPFRAKEIIKTYEDKWLPKNLVLPASSFVVKRLSETDFIYLDKYRFEGTELGFKCGLCPHVSLFCFYKSSSLWYNIVLHIRKWHKGDHKVRVQTIRQTCVQVTPSRFHYGKYVFEEIDGKYQCGDCGSLIPAGPRNQVKTRYIREHIIEQHINAPRTFVCEYCGAILKNQDSLKMHKIIKHERPSNQFPCSECGKMFVSRSIASTHHKAVHQGLYKGNKSICEICGKEFGNKVTLKDHVAFVHNGQMIECKDCGKMFASQAALYTHRYSHTGKKFTCDICGMEFTQHYSVTRHKKTAHGT